MIRAARPTAPPQGIGTALLDLDGRLTDANRTLATLFGASPADLDLTVFERLVQGFSFRNVAASLIERVDPEREVVCEVTWSHPRAGARSGRLVVSRLNQPGGEACLVVRLAPDPDHHPDPADGAHPEAHPGGPADPSPR
jgi:PAS domain-containing protein